MKVLACIEALTVPSPHYADIASVYFTARLIIANTPDKQDFATTLRESASLHSTLAIYRKITSQKLGYHSLYKKLDNGFRNDSKARHRQRSVLKF